MKKVSLLTLLTIATITTSVGAKVNIENPLYMPTAGKFVVQTEISNKDIPDFADRYSLVQSLAYGIKDDMSILASVEYMDLEAKNDGEDENGFANFKIGSMYRFNDVFTPGFIMDLYTQYGMTIDEDVEDEHMALEIGTRFGKIFGNYTLAGRVAYQFQDYDKKDGEGEDSASNFSVGFEGQYSYSDKLSTSLGLDYVLQDDRASSTGDDSFQITAGANIEFHGLWTAEYVAELSDDAQDDSIVLKYSNQF